MRSVVYKDTWCVASKIARRARARRTAAACLGAHPYIGQFTGDPQNQDDLDDFAEFTDVVNASFGWMSMRIAEEAERLKGEYSVREAVIVGDFETGDLSLPAVSEYYDAGYVEAFFFLYPAPGALRTAQGIDNIYVKPDNVDILRAFYDMSYGRADSDHDPYYADFEIR